MNDWSRARVAALDAEDLDGYVLKKDSPSCGMERVKVHGEIFRVFGMAAGSLPPRP